MRTAVVVLVPLLEERLNGLPAGEDGLAQAESQVVDIVLGEGSGLIEQSLLHPKPRLPHIQQLRHREHRRHARRLLGGHACLFHLGRHGLGLLRPATRELLLLLLLLLRLARPLLMHRPLHCRTLGG